MNFRISVLITLYLTLFISSCVIKTYVFETHQFNSSNSIDGIFENNPNLNELIKNEIGLNAELIDYYEFDYYECEVNINGIVEYEYTQLDSCIGNIYNKHELNLYVFDKIENNEKAFLFISSRKNVNELTEGPSFMFFGTKAEGSFKDAIYFYKRYTYKSKLIKEEEVHMSVFYKEFQNQFEFVEIFSNDKNRIGASKGLAFDLEKILHGDIVLLKMQIPENINN